MTFVILREALATYSASAPNCGAFGARRNGRPSPLQREDNFMTYVVTEACINCKHTDCVDVCPVDAFREGPNFLVIDPQECIDCTLCVPECPVDAIYAEDDVPAGQEPFIALNAELAQEWKPIVQIKPAPEDAGMWAKVKDKLKFLQR